MQPSRGMGSGRPPGMPGPFDGAPVTKWLLIINIAVLIIDALLKAHPPLFLRDTWGYLSVEKAVYQGQIWRFISFQFLHANFGHLLSNSIGIFFFGPHIERWMSSRPFLVFYLLSGLAGALFYTLLFFIPGVFEVYGAETRMVGASAGVFGILAAFYYVAPEARVLLFFVIPMKMRTLGIAYFAYEAFRVVFVMDNAGGSAGHLGGAIFGLLVLKTPKAREWIIKLSQIGNGTKRPPKIRDAHIVREDHRSPIELSREIDRILDKISSEGIQSLTPRERETLDKARKN
ncbi:rhomboid family intramembrane serine protease [Verrucomicrobiaceae bacterium 227]